MMVNEHFIIGNNSYEKVDTFKYLGSLLINQNSFYDEIKCNLKAGNLFYCSILALLSSWLLSKHLKIKIYKTVISSVVVYDCETWSLRLKEECRLRLFQNRILRQTIVWAQKESEWGVELHSLFHLSKISRVIKSWRLRWAGQLVRMKEDKNSFKIEQVNLQTRDL